MKRKSVLIMPFVLALCACGGGQTAVVEETAVPEVTATAEAATPAPTAGTDTGDSGSFGV